MSTLVPLPRRYTRVSRLLLLALLLAGALLPTYTRAAHSTVTLGFDGGATGTIVNSGFTTVLPGTNAPDTSRLTLANGQLTVRPTAGDIAARTAQDNALALPSSSHGAYTVAARILGPLPNTSSTWSGGVFVGLSERSFVRVSAGVGTRRARAERIQIDVNDNGKLRSSTLTLPAGTLASVDQWLDLFLTIDHGTGRISALYRIDSESDADIRLATTRGLPKWLRVQGNQTVPVFAGIVTTSSASTTPPLALAFDWFRISETPVVATVSGAKTVDLEQVTPGGQLTYTINVVNNGAPATFRIVDPIPVDTAYVAGSATASTPGNQPAFDEASGSVVWQGGLNTGGAVTLTFQVTVNEGALQSGTIINQATLTNLTTGGLPTVFSAQTVVEGAPDLAGSDYTASPATVGPGDILTYTLNIRNDGTADAEGLSAVMSIPAETTYVPGSASAPSGNLTINSFVSQIAWSAAGPLAPGAAVPITFQVQVGSGFANGASIESQATVQGSNVLPQFEVARATVSVVTALAGTLAADKLEANPGDTLTYTLTVLNTGNTPASFQVVDPIPADTAYVNNSVTSPATYDGVGRLVRWQGTLDPGASATVSFQVTINQPPLQSATITNQATLLNTSAGGTSSMLTATTTVRGTPSLAGSTYTVSPLVIAADTVATFSLNVLNNGTAAATGATAQLTIPAGTTYVAGSARATSGVVTFDVAGGRVNWSAGTLVPAGGVVQITFQARVGNGIPQGARITSQATLQATGAGQVVRTAQASFSADPLGPAMAPLYLPMIGR
ncbi:MAG TPA: hypothetical protein VNL77_24695 [Roseiflexaceae bacterium]|nr:hypothetical protein [Roseiflexaceae bacterium]